MVKGGEGEITENDKTEKKGNEKEIKKHRKGDLEGRREKTDHGR